MGREADRGRETDAAREAAGLWFTDAELHPFGDGHIHDTYLLHVDGADYVLQRINEYVFVDAELVMRQVRSLLQHAGGELPFTLPWLVASKSDAMTERTDVGLWRVWQRLPGVTLQKAEYPQQAFAAGEAFAQLQVATFDLTPKLRPTIDNFLKLDHYLRGFDSLNGVSDQHRRLVDEYRYLSEYLQEANAHIHGDCKVDNLLFSDETLSGGVVGMLDFDTAMFGNRAWDYGDLVRSLNTSAGDVQVDLIAAAYHGFAAGGVRLGVDEALQAPNYVTFMLGLRFLNDHLCGDPYFKVSQHGENLARAEEQFRLLADLQAAETTLRQAFVS